MKIFGRKPTDWFWHLLDWMGEKSSPFSTDPEACDYCRPCVLATHVPGEDHHELSAAVLHYNEGIGWRIEKNGIFSDPLALPESTRRDWPEAQYPRLLIVHDAGSIQNVRPSGNAFLLAIAPERMQQHTTYAFIVFKNKAELAYRSSPHGADKAVSISQYGFNDVVQRTAKVNVVTLQSDTTSSTATRTMDLAAEPPQAVSLGSLHIDVVRALGFMAERFSLIRNCGMQILALHGPGWHLARGTFDHGDEIVRYQSQALHKAYPDVVLFVVSPEAENAVIRIEAPCNPEFTTNDRLVVTLTEIGEDSKPKLAVAFEEKALAG